MLKISLWNSNKLANKVGELINFLYRYHVDIMIITETKLAQNNKLKIRNYSIYRADRNIRGASYTN